MPIYCISIKITIIFKFSCENSYCFHLKCFLTDVKVPRKVVSNAILENFLIRIRNKEGSEQVNYLLLARNGQKLTHRTAEEKQQLFNREERMCC